MSLIADHIKSTTPRRPRPDVPYTVACVAALLVALTLGILW